MNKGLKLIFLMAILGLAANACQQVAAIEYVKYQNEASVPRISVEEAKKEVDAGKAVFVESRGDMAWKQERLPGALNVTSATIDGQLATLPKGKKLIIYCACSAEQTSAHLAFVMNEKGVPGTYALLGGPTAWKSAGFPVETGDIADGGSAH